MISSAYRFILIKTMQILVKKLPTVVDVSFVVIDN